MSRPTVATIDLDAIRHNYRLAKSQVHAARAVAIIKANAYGHGAVAVAKALENDADAFGVACLEEALELRESGIDSPILLLEGIFSFDEMEVVFREKLMLAVHTQEQLDWLQNSSSKGRATVFLKLDSGMHRLGFSPELAREKYQLLQSIAQVEDIVLMTHFARADEVGQTFNSVQSRCFETVFEGISAASSIANSAAVLALPEATKSQWLRPGIMLYGASPLDQENHASLLLLPAMTFSSAIIAVRELAVGEAIGYGGRYVCQRPTRVAVVAAGYADGYPRHAKDGTPVNILGKSSRIIGRVSMDMLTVDITDIPEARIGSEVELWGKNVPANEVARHSDTIAYQLFTGITRRVPMRYI